MNFSGLEPGEAQRLCSKYNLELENPYDEIKALNAPLLSLLYFSGIHQWERQKQFDLLP